MNLPLEGLNILVVDDSLDNQFLFERLLVRRGAKVALAGNGLEGTKMALEGNFEIVLMDIQMPIMDGYAAMEKLKAANYSRPVIALTALHKNEESEEMFQAKFSAHISKPIDTQALVASIQHLAGRKLAYV